MQEIKRKFWFVGKNGVRMMVQGNSMHDRSTPSPDFSVHAEAEDYAQRQRPKQQVYRCEVYEEGDKLCDL